MSVQITVLRPVIVEPTYEYSYIVYPDDPANPSTYHVKNGRTGVTEYSSSDAMVAIQYAIDKAHAMGGGLVFLKRGYYPVSDRIVLRDNIVLRGEGWGTFVEMATTPPVPRPVFGLYGVRNVAIMDLKVSGGEPAETESRAEACIFIAGGSKNVVVANVYARGAKYPIYIGGGSSNSWNEDIIVYGNIAEYAYDDCITATLYSRRVIIANNIVRYAKDIPGLGNAGIELDDSVEDIIVEGNLVYGNADRQIDVHMHDPPIHPADAPVNQRIIIRGNIAVSRYRIDGTGLDYGITLNVDEFARQQGVDVVIEGNISIGTMSIRAGFERVAVKNNVIVPQLIIGHNVSGKAVVRDVVAEGNIIIGSSDRIGVEINTFSERVAFAGNTLIYGNPGIRVRGRGVAIRSNYIYNNFYEAIYVLGSGTVVEGNWIIDDREPASKMSRGIMVRNAVDVVVRNNVIDGCTAVAVFAVADPGYTSDRLVIEGNRITNIYSPYQAIYIPSNVCPTMCMIKDNFIDNVTHDTGSPRCIIIDHNNRVYIINNMLGRSVDNRRIQVGDSEAYIIGNVLFAGGTIAITTTKPYIIRGNVGYRTEGSGVATIPAGSTRVTVSHGLVSAPSKVLVTPFGDVRVWVENITSTSFDIVTDMVPSADVKVAWYAEV